MNLNIDKKINKDIFDLAWPCITEQLLIMTVGVVSTIFTGRLGKEYLAAVSMVNMIILLFQTIFAGFATGASVIISRFCGQKEYKKSKTSIIQTIIICESIGLLITIFAYLTSTVTLKMFFSNSQENVLKAALTYYKVALFGIPFMVLDIVISGCQRGAGDTKTPMYISAIVNLINLLLNSTLIFGINFGAILFIPKLGIKGAAIAVTISRISGGLMRLFTLYFINGKINLSFKDKYIINTNILKKVIKVGLPSFLEQFIMQMGYLVGQMLIVSIGTTAAASYAIGSNVNSIVSMPMFGFSVATTSLVGQLLGSKEFDLSEKYAHEALKTALCIIAVLSITMFIFAKPIASIYSNDIEVIKSSIPIIRIYACVEPFLAIMFISAGILRAGGDVVYVMFTALIGLWLFRILIAFSLNKLLNIGIYSIMIGISFDFGIRATMYFLRMKNGKWKYLKI